MSSEANLSSVSTDALAQELVGRSDLFTEDGLLRPPMFAVMDALGIRVCVDGAPLRKNSRGKAELMAIRRGTGPYAGKLCLIGGGVANKQINGVIQPESISEALSRHFMTDLGTTVNILNQTVPQYVQQEMRSTATYDVRPDFVLNPNSRHLIALRYLVSLPDDFTPTYGSTTLGGQEATDIEWFTKATMPSAQEFGYDMINTYDSFFEQAHQYLP